MESILILAGGGDEKASKEIDNYFIAKLKQRGKNSILYIPLAMASRSYSQCLKWFNSIFNSHISQIKMCLDLSNLTSENLKRFGAIYIGGGDTGKLWHLVQNTTFDTFLKDYINSGGIVYGGSAGAIILGKDIRTTSEVAPYHFQSFQGIDAIGGYSIFCHYKQNKQQEDVLNISKQIHTPIIAIPEGSAIIKTRNKISILGKQPVTVFTAIGIAILAETDTLNTA